MWGLIFFLLRGLQYTSQKCTCICNTRLTLYSLVGDIFFEIVMMAAYFPTPIYTSSEK